MLHTRFSPQRLAILAFAVLFVAVMVPAPAQCDTSPQAPAPRKDRVFGTSDEGIHMERRDDTGDRIIRVQPAPRHGETPQQEYHIPLTIEPNISITPKNSTAPGQAPKE